MWKWAFEARAAVRGAVSTSTTQNRQITLRKKLLYKLPHIKRIAGHAFCVSASDTRHPQKNTNELQQQSSLQIISSESMYHISVLAVNTDYRWHFKRRDTNNSVLLSLCISTADSPLTDFLCVLSPCVPERSSFWSLHCHFPIFSTHPRINGYYVPKTERKCHFN